MSVRAGISAADGSCAILREEALYRTMRPTGLGNDEDAMSEIHKNYIGGEWVAGDGVTRDVNPSNTADVVGEYAQANAAQTGEAVAAARTAFAAWSRTTPQERHDILL